jgi:hypothetical protein
MDDRDARGRSALGGILSIEPAHLQIGPQGLSTLRACRTLELIVLVPRRHNDIVPVHVQRGAPERLDRGMLRDLGLFVIVTGGTPPK